MAPASCRRFAFSLLTASAFAAVAAPAPSADDVAASAAIAAAKRRAERADYQLLYIYPDEATYRKAKVAELDFVKANLHQAGLRLDELLAKRKTLVEKAEFYRGKTLTAELQAQMDESDASLTASMYVFRGLEQEVARIVDKYERPRARLEKLWAGAALGSMGLYDPNAPASAPAAR